MSISCAKFVARIANQLKENKRLEKTIAKFYNDYGLTACIGVEIEFYLSVNICASSFEKLLQMEVKREKGSYQFEINLPPSTDLMNYINIISDVKARIQHVATSLNGEVDFSAKPFLNDYGSSMHFHVNFFSQDGLYYCTDRSHDNILGYYRQNPSCHTGVGRYPEKYSMDSCFRGNDVCGDLPSNVCDRLPNGICGSLPVTRDFIYAAAQSICRYMLDSFVIFMPYHRSYQRLDKNFMAPINVSFGGNNRTVAIRVPDSTPPRLEHRLACPEVDPYAAIFTILHSILLGMEFPEKISNYTKIYGNAFDAQYDLLPLPTSYQKSLQFFKSDFFG